MESQDFQLVLQDQYGASVGCVKLSGKRWALLDKQGKELWSFSVHTKIRLSELIDVLTTKRLRGVYIS